MFVHPIPLAQCRQREDARPALCPPIDSLCSGAEQRPHGGAFKALGLTVATLRNRDSAA